MKLLEPLSRSERIEIKRAARMHSRTVLARHLAIVDREHDAREWDLALGLIVRKSGHIGLIEFLEGMIDAEPVIDTTKAGALIAERMAFIKSLKMLRGWSHEITEAA